MAVGEGDFGGLDQQVRAKESAGDFAAVRAVAEMASSVGAEEMVVVDFHFDGWDGCESAGGGLGVEWVKRERVPLQRHSPSIVALEVDVW